MQRRNLVAFGVTIVAPIGTPRPTTQLLAQGPPTRFMVDERPLLVLPAVQAEPFGRVIGAVRLSDGAIAVADDSEHRIRFFRASGAEYASVGGRGGGPGEFGLLASMERCGRDTVLAFDAEHSRATVLTGKGQVARTFKILAGDNKLVYRVACNRGRSLLVLGWPRLPKDAPPGPYRPSLTIYVADLSGRSTGELGEFPADERYRFARGDGTRIFGKQLLVAGAGDRILVGDGNRYSVAVLGPGGEVVGTIQKRTAQILVRAADIDRYVSEYLPLVRDPVARESQRRGFKEYDFPTHYPPYSAMLVDAGGQIWIRDYRTPTQDRETWSVFSPRGPLLGEVPMPPSLEVFDISADLVIGRLTAEDGSHRVVVHQLTKIQQ